jgi:phage-related protein
MTTTFPSTIKPVTSSSRRQTPRVKSIQFGNGYKQITGDGLNSNLEKWDLTFMLNDTDKQTVEDFFSVTGGYNYFNWTSPETGATQKQYIVTTWSIQPIGVQTYSITCSFEEFPGLTS